MFNVFTLNELLASIPPEGIDQMMGEHLTILQHYKKNEAITKAQLFSFLDFLQNILLQNDKKPLISTLEVRGDIVSAEEKRLTILLEQTSLENFLTYSEITLNTLETVFEYFPDNKDLLKYIRNISMLHLNFLTSIEIGQAPQYDISDPNIQ